MIVMLLCAGKILTANAIIIPIEFEKDSEKFTTETRRELSLYSEELYLAKGIKVTLQEPPASADVKKQALFYKREKELKEFFKEEHLDFNRISFTYEVESKKGPVITVEIASNEVFAEVIRPDSTFTNKNSIVITCKPEDLELANTLTFATLTNHDEMYNTNVSSYFENKIILIRELIKVDFQSGRVPNKPVTAQLPVSVTDKKSYLLLRWNNINREWTKTGTTFKVSSKNQKQFVNAKIEESGIYALAESKSVSVQAVTALSPKNAAITYIELISTEPFVRIEGAISDNQKQASFKGPKNRNDFIIRAVLQDANGKEWVEETRVKKKTILSVFQSKKKITAYLN